MEYLLSLKKRDNLDFMPDLLSRCWIGSHLRLVLTRVRGERWSVGGLCWSAPGSPGVTPGVISPGRALVLFRWRSHRWPSHLTRLGSLPDVHVYNCFGVRNLTKSPHFNINVSPDHRVIVSSWGSGCLFGSYQMPDMSVPMLLPSDLWGATHYIRPLLVWNITYIQSWTWSHFSYIPVMQMLHRLKSNTL